MQERNKCAHKQDLVLGGVRVRVFSLKTIIGKVYILKKSKRKFPNQGGRNGGLLEGVRRVVP